MINVAVGINIYNIWAYFGIQCLVSSITNSAVTVTPSTLKQSGRMTGNESGSAMWELQTVLLQYQEH